MRSSWRECNANNQRTSKQSTILCTQVIDGANMPIKKTKGGYKIQNVKGTSKTKKDATKRLRAIKANQASKKAQKKSGCSCHSKRR